MNYVICRLDDTLIFKTYLKHEKLNTSDNAYNPSKDNSISEF